MALMTLNLAAVPAKIAIPVLVGLAGATSAIGAYVAQPTPVAASVITDPAALTAKEQVVPPRPCEQQAWPYIDNGCIAANMNSSSRAVRVVLAPRQDDAPSKATGVPHVVAPQAAIDEAAKLISRDTVLRQPEMAPAPKVAKPRAKRNEARAGRRWAAQSYQVPAEGYGRPSRALMVVRPLRGDAFR